MIQFDEGLTLCGRVTCGLEVGFIVEVGLRTYTIKWRDGFTTQLRPDLCDCDADDLEFQQAAE